MRQILNNCLKNSHLSNFGGLFAFQRLVDMLFKQDCVLCNAKTDALEPSIHAVCRACLNDLPWHTNQACPQCALLSDGNLCGSCLNSPPDFDATHAVFLYDYPIDAKMVRFKYGSLLSLSQTFGELLHYKLLQHKISANNIDLIIPMPMHPERLKARGFNQAHEIGHLLSKNFPEK